MEEDNQNSEVEEEGEDEHRVHVGTGVEVGGGDRETFEGWSERWSIKLLLMTLVKDQGTCGIQDGKSWDWKIQTDFPIVRRTYGEDKFPASQTVILHFSPALSALHCSSSSIVFSLPIHCCCGDGVYERQPLMKGRANRAKLLNEQGIVVVVLVISCFKQYVGASLSLSQSFIVIWVMQIKASGVMKLEVTKFRPREVVRHVLLTATVPLQRILTLEGHVAHDVPVEITHLKRKLDFEFQLNEEE